MRMRAHPADAAVAEAPREGVGISSWSWSGPADDTPPGRDAERQGQWWVQQAPTADPETYRRAPLPDSLRMIGAALEMRRARRELLMDLDPESRRRLFAAEAALRRYELRCSTIVCWILGDPPEMTERQRAAKGLLDEFGQSVSARAGERYGEWEGKVREAAVAAATPEAAAPSAASSAARAASQGVDDDRPLSLAAISHAIQSARRGERPEAGEAATVVAASTAPLEEAVTEVRAPAPPPPAKKPKGAQPKASPLEPAQAEAGRQAVAAAVQALQAWPQFDEFGRQEAVLNGLIAERARLALRAGDARWTDHLQQVLAEQQILTARYGDADCAGLVEWARRDPQARQAFATLWEEPDLERALDGFCAMVPLDKEDLGNNSIAQVASILVSARDPYNLPPLQAHSQDLAKITGLPTIASSAPVGRRYALMLENLRTLQADLAGRGVRVPDLAGMYGVSVYVGNPRFLNYDTAPGGPRFDALYRDLVQVHTDNGGRKFTATQMERDPIARKEIL